MRAVKKFVLAGTALVMALVFSPVPNAVAATGDRMAQIAAAELNNSAHNHEVGGCNFYAGQLYGTGSGCQAGWRGGDWCADFVKYIWRQAGGVSYLNEIDSWAQSFKDYAVDHGTWHPIGSGYAPKPGDAIVYKDLGGTPGKADHVGMVVSYSGGTVTTIEGNWDSRVSQRTNPTNAQGYASPVGRDTSPWAGWQDLDGSLASGPTVISRWGQSLEVFANGVNNAVYSRGWTQTAWTPWKKIGGDLTSDPTAVSWGTARIDLFGRDRDGKVSHAYSNSAGSTYSEWDALPDSPTIDGAPVAVSWGVNRIDLVVRDQTTKHILHSSFNGSAWSVWGDLGLSAKSGPAAATWGPGRLDVFTLGGEGNNLMHRWFTGGAWSPWENLGGHLTSDPDAVSRTTGTLDIVARGTDNAVWHRAWTGSAWTTWSEIGGYITSAPAITSWGGTRLDVFARGGDAGLYHTWRN